MNMSETAMNEKFIPPRLPGVAIDRYELFKFFDKKWDKRLLYVCAPAGYGKTVSTILYLKHRKLKTAWMNLDEYDNSPAPFYEFFLTAVSYAAGGNDGIMTLLKTPGFAMSPDEYAIKAVSSLKIDEESVLVIDDFHIITDSDILRSLPLIIRRLPNTIKVAFISRTEPVAFHDSVLKERLSVISTNDLIFTGRDIRRFFEKKSIKLTQREAENTLCLTNGWAIAVNALAITGNAHITSAMDNKYLQTYIKTEIWRHFSEETKSFLLKTSLADEICPGLCERLTGNPDSAGVLETLWSSNFFISETSKGVYRYHDLFKGFLNGVMEAESLDKRGIYAEMARWYTEQGDFRKASDCCLANGDFDGFSDAISRINKYKSEYGSVETEIEYITTRVLDSIPESAIEQSPSLMEICAFGCYLRGDGRRFTHFMDSLYNVMDGIAGTMPDFYETLMFMSSLDYRIPLLDICRRVSEIEIPNDPDKKPNSNTLSQNLPFFHRSQRDYSEFLKDPDAERLLDSSFKKLIGGQYEAIKACIFAGLALERNMLDEAFEYAVLANSKLENGFASELKFNALIMLAEAQYARGEEKAAEKTEKYTAEMIDSENAHYLHPNLRAYVYRRKIRKRNISFANEWLARYSANPSNPLSFYEIYQHFTTARAYILTGEYGAAILFIAKLSALAEMYNRPLDILEAAVLHSIALWKDAKFKASVVCMERAALLACEYGYVRIFMDECADAEIILRKLYSKAVQNKSLKNDEINFIKSLYHIVYTQAGKPGAERPLPQRVKLSKQQKMVMKILAEGKSYREAAEETGLSLSTIKTHIKGAYVKLGVSNAGDALTKINELSLFKEE